MACAQPMAGGTLISYPCHSVLREWHLEERAPTSLYDIQIRQAAKEFSSDVRAASLAEVGNHVFQGSKAMTRQERATFQTLMAKQSKRIR